MKNLLIIILPLLMGAAPAGLTEGDIIFQKSLSGQSQAIQKATRSEYSHVGLLIETPQGLQVIEAIQPVSITLLEKWIARGADGHCVVKRLKDPSSLTAENRHLLRQAALKYLGRDYDLWFGWGDDRIYCSELVYKAYHYALGIEIGKVRKLKDFDLTHPAVRKKLQQRYGRKIPLNEKVISPADQFNSPLLVEVGRT